MSTEFKIGDIVYCDTGNSDYEFNDKYVILNTSDLSILGRYTATICSLRTHSIFEIDRKCIYKNKIDILKNKLEEYKKYREEKLAEMDAHIKELEEQINKELNK